MGKMHKSQGYSLTKFDKCVYQVTLDQIKREYFYHHEERLHILSNKPLYAMVPIAIPYFLSNGTCSWHSKQHDVWRALYATECLNTLFLFCS